MGRQRDSTHYQGRVVNATRDKEIPIFMGKEGETGRQISGKAIAYMNERVPGR